MKWNDMDGAIIVREFSSYKEKYCCEGSHFGCERINVIKICVFLPLI